MSLDYWFEQMKASVAIAAHLAVPAPVDSTPTPTPAATPTSTRTAKPPATSTATPKAARLYLPVLLRF